MKHILFVCIGFLVYSCSTPKNSNKKIFYYNEQTGIQSLDPAYAKNQSIMWALHQLYNTLVEVDDNLQIKPSLAKSWDFSNDRKTITFHLRTDVFFHNDKAFKNIPRKFIAADVVYSFSRIIDKKIASDGAWIFNDRVDSIQPFIALNDTTFQLKLKQPVEFILGVLTMQYCSIVAKEAVDFYGATFRANACGTGPFRLEQWEEGMGLTMIKNDLYFEKDSIGNRLPYLDGVSISFYDSKATEFLLFRKGKIDFINDIDPSFKDEILNKKGDLKEQWRDKIQLNKKEYLNLEYLGILQKPIDGNTKNPLLNKKIRQAINYGFNRDKMMLYFRNSIGTAATAGVIPKGLPGFDPTKIKGYNYNPEKAKQLLKEANYTGQKIAVYTIPIYQDLAIYIAKELEQIGINLEVNAIQKALLLEKTSKQQASFFRGSWIADYPDAENYLTLFYSKNPAPPNYTRYSNKEFDVLYEAAMQEPNYEKRINLYQQMDNLIMEEAVIIPLWYDMVIHMVQPNVKNFHPTCNNLLELRNVSK